MAQRPAFEIQGLVSYNLSPSQVLKLWKTRGTIFSEVKNFRLNTLAVTSMPVSSQRLYLLSSTQPWMAAPYFKRQQDGFQSDIQACLLVNLKMQSWKFVKLLVWSLTYNWHEFAQFKKYITHMLKAKVCIITHQINAHDFFVVIVLVLYWIHAYIDAHDLPCLYPIYLELSCLMSWACFCAF